MVPFRVLLCRQDSTLKPMVITLYVIVCPSIYIFASTASNHCKHDMGALLWLNAEPPERVPTPLFGRLIRCSAHPPHTYLLSSCVAILPYSKSLNHSSLAFAVKNAQDSGDINYYINLNIDVSAQNMTSLAPTVPVAPAQLRRLAITVILDVASFPGHGLYSFLYVAC